MDLIDFKASEWFWRLPLHTLSYMIWFCTPPPFWGCAFFIYGRRSVAVARYWIICLVLLLSNFFFIDIIIIFLHTVSLFTKFNVTIITSNYYVFTLQITCKWRSHRLIWSISVKSWLENLHLTVKLTLYAAIWWFIIEYAVFTETYISLLLLRKPENLLINEHISLNKDPTDRNEWGQN